MTEQSFASLLESYLDDVREVKLEEVIKGRVVAISKGYVFVDVGLKSEAAIDENEYKNAQGELEVQVGDETEVVLKAVENGNGETIVSRSDARRNEAWVKLQNAHDTGEIIEGFVNSKVKGGFTVELDGIRAFLPGSLVDIRPVRDVNLEGQTLELKVVKLDQKRNNVVVSRKAVLETANNKDRDAILAVLEEGAVVTGVVKNLTDYGAFVDLGGFDGLLHITDMAWKRVHHPSEVVEIGQEVKVKVLKFEKDRTRVSLGLKQLEQDPWLTVTQTYPVNSKLRGSVTNLTDYGCFVEIAEGVEGLVHISEMDWTNKNIHAAKVVNLGEEVEVMVLEIDEERRRISLGLKQCKPNPWENFDKNYHKGDKVKGKIKSITDFGIFIGLDGGIDGLVHVSDISWTVSGDEAVKQYKKGDEVEAIVLQVDAVKERISLGIKQLGQDNFTAFLDNHKRGASVRGKVIDLDAKGARVELEGGVEAYLRATEAAVERVDDLTKVLAVGDEVTARYTGADRRKRIINISVRAQAEAEESATIKHVNKQDTLEVPNAFAQAFAAAKAE